jgi:ATP-dependent RNA helicase DDX54/DBP10
MEDQFLDLHNNPDILIATPGRFMHIIVEMGLNLSTVEYIVFDEADRYVLESLLGTEVFFCC